MLLTRIVALLLAFLLGFASCAGLLIGGAYAALNSFKLRDIEKYGLADIPEEMFMGENYEVDLLSLTAFGLVDELKTLQSLGNDVTLSFIISRYDLKIPSKVNAFLPEDAKNIPIKKLFSNEGIHELLSTVYIGTAQGFECHAIDSADPADPALGKDNARWYDPKRDEYVSGINETISFFNLNDIAGGKINVDTLMDDIILADVLGYHGELNEETGKTTWYDSNGEKVTGIMAVFADCTINSIGTKINEVKIGELIGYEEGEDGAWYTTNEETGEMEKVHGFMNAVANNSIDSLGGMFDDLTIGDLVPEEDRSGIFAIIPADSKLNEISSAVNSSIQDSPMQFFMNQGMIAFEESQQNSLDTICTLKGETVTYSPDDETFIKYYYSEDMSWEMDADGNYIIPTWRTQPLNMSFSYIVGLLVSNNPIEVSDAE